MTQIRQWMRAGLIAALVLLVHRPTVNADDVPPSATAETASALQRAPQATDRALTFLVEDTAKWRQARGCATCHHGAMTVWTLSEAQQQGYAIDSAVLDDILKWTKDLFVPQFNKPRDPRWGYNFVSLPGIYLSLMSDSLPILSRDEVNHVAVHLARHQEADGTWAMPFPPPNPNVSPPTWESQETLTLLALLAWEQHVPSDPAEAEQVRGARERAVAWLAAAPPTDTTQALTWRLLLDVRSQHATAIPSRIDELLKRQNADGGWSQTPELASDAYATGQALWVLSFAGLQRDDPHVERAIAFLVTSQQEDGSWPMTPRFHPGADREKDRYMMPLTYFGAAWGTLGLVRYVRPHLDAATQRQRAIDYIRTFSGTYTVDEAAPDKPITAVTIRRELDDDQVSQLAELLVEFPQLASLSIAGHSVTDAGAARLCVLTQLRSLSLEEATVTDVGLAALKALTSLEELNLKGSQITDAGVADLQQAVPQVVVVR